MMRVNKEVKPSWRGVPHRYEWYIGWLNAFWFTLILLFCHFTFKFYEPTGFCVASNPMTWRKIRQKEKRYGTWQIFVWMCRNPSKCLHLFFQYLLNEGLPPTPTQCVLQSLSKGILEVRCRNSSKGSAEKETEESSETGSGDSENKDEYVDDDDEDVLVSGSSNVYWLQLYSADTGVLLRNMSNKVAPHFSLSGIDPSTRVAAIVMTINKQGRSEAVTLEGAVERAVGSRAG